MAPGPRGPGGGPRGGGPRGGHRGGPRGGMHGGHRRPGMNVMPPTYTGGLSGSSGNTDEVYYDEDGNRITAGAMRRKKYGTVKGTVLGLKLSTTGAMKEELFFARCRSIDDLLAMNTITQDEAKKRKKEAAEKFHGYLRDIGYYTEEEYLEKMREFSSNYAPNSPLSGMSK